MRIDTARIGKGKAVHLFWVASGRTDCGAGGMSDTAPIPTDGPVTCKRCLKELAIRIERAHAEAIALNDTRPTTVRPGRRQRATNRRAMAAKRRDLARTVRQQRRAVKAVATGSPQTARTHLLAAGVDAADAKRYAGAFSRGVAPTSAALATVKLRGRVTRTVPVKLYDTATFATRLAVYRPKDTDAAARLTRVVMQLGDAFARAGEAAARLSTALRAA
jgi:hypothetical protein